MTGSDEEEIPEEISAGSVGDKSLSDNEVADNTEVASPQLTEQDAASLAISTYYDDDDFEEDSEAEVLLKGIVFVCGIASYS